MRRLAWLSLPLFLAWSNAARADITAEYSVQGPRALDLSMIVEVADNGDARILMHDGETMAIRRDGILYQVHRDAQGSFVLTWEEFARIQAQVERESGPTWPEAPPARIVECGTDTVAGRQGVVLTMQGPDETDCSRGLAFVVNSDADLAPVGPLVAAMFGGPGLETVPYIALLREIYLRGTLIRNFMLRLERTSDARIPPAVFELPGPVLGGEAARARLGPAL
jgi:hypothetical protein